MSLLPFSNFLFMVSLVHEMNSGETWNYEPSHFCVNFSCLGKPWCMEWQFHNFLPELIKPMKFNNLETLKIGQIEF